MLRTILTPLLCSGLLAVAFCSTGCFPKRYNADMASARYPAHLGQSEIANVQVMRDGDSIVIVNATARDFRDISLWLNRRYELKVDRIAPGETVSYNVGEFWDAWGGGPNPGGLLRWYDPTPVVLMQAQLDEESPLVGFLSIPETDELDR